MSDPEELTDIIEQLETAYAEGLKELVETKHIYQRVRVDVDGLVASYCDRPTTMEQATNREYAAYALQIMERLPAARQRLFLATGNGQGRPAPVLLLRNLKLYCPTCGEREVFAPVAWNDVLEKAISEPQRPNVSVQPTMQVYTIAYQCQRCHGTPTCFMVRRERGLLVLEGRSPFEEIEVPPFIPKEERALYRNALIARNGGQPLAALFYLRTFIEQVGRRVSGKGGRLTGDEILDAYAETLPVKFRDAMPSLKEWYDKLSGAIHAAKGNEALCEEALAALKQHFDMLRVLPKN